MKSPWLPKNSPSSKTSIEALAQRQNALI
jgi:hypothetical protein